MGKTVTINDIAEQLNMSRNTVAKALNGKYVPEKTRRLIIEKAEELNYKGLGEAAEKRSDSTYKKRRILLLSGKPLNNIKFFVPIIKGIENLCFSHKHELMQYICNEENVPFSSIYEYIKAFNADGIIAIECFNRRFIGKLLKFGLPVCFIDFAADSPTIAGNYDVIGTNNFYPVFDLTKSLHRQYGLRRFCFVGDYMHCLSFQERYFGMLQALAVCGIEHTAAEDIMRSDAFNYANPTAIRAEIAKLKFMPECFICGNDFIARSVCNALHLLNVEVPRQCLVAGYDNVLEASSAKPEISSFSTNKESLGAEAVRLLLSRIERPHISNRILVVRARFVPRESTSR